MHSRLEAFHDPLLVLCGPSYLTPPQSARPHTFPFPDGWPSPLADPVSLPPQADPDINAESLGGTRHQPESTQVPTIGTGHSVIEVPPQDNDSQVPESQEEMGSNASDSGSSSFDGYTYWYNDYLREKAMGTPVLDMIVPSGSTAQLERATSMPPSPRPALGHNKPNEPRRREVGPRRAYTIARQLSRELATLEAMCARLRRRHARMVRLSVGPRNEIIN
ncbi:hypothetical protein BD779DRAFT_1677812 [Infundibulicybe gibba]|nr:hypothetical protein BD779DRAFT_1478740 [Infundibulicybe gibba]KAF8876418.1 hypothetical protein BD779DRAFT_1677812 [Infundibulicybe gibba]